MIVGLSITGSASSGNPLIALTASGQVFITSSNTPGTFAELSPGFAANCRDSAVDSVNLYTAVSQASAMGVMALGTNTFSTISTPSSLSIPSMVATPPSGVASGHVAVAGWQLASLASGCIALQGNPALGSSVAVLATSSALTVLTGSDPTWAVASSVTGLSSLAAIAWNPNGTQLLAAVSGGIDIFTYTTGALSLASSVAVTGCVNIDITPDSVNALCCIPSANVVQILTNSLGVWSLTSSFSVTSPKAIVLTSATTGWIICGTNAAPITKSGSVWSIGTGLSLTATANAITEDALTGNVLVVGGTGTTGYISLIKNGIVASTLTYSGAYGIAVLSQNGEVAVLMSDGTTIRMLGVLGNTIVAQGINTLSAPSGSTAFGVTSQSVWLCGSSATYQCSWEKPYELRQKKSGTVAVYSRPASSWATYSLGVGSDPSAIAWDTSGNVWAATTENTLYSFTGTPTGTVLPLLTQNTVPVFTGQASGTAMGISSLTWSNGHLYATTAFAGALVEIM